MVVGAADAPAAAAAAGCLRLNSTETWEQTNGSERRSKRCVMLVLPASCAPAQRPERRPMIGVNFSRPGINIIFK